MDYDDAYANAAYIPGAEDYPPRWERDAAAFRASSRSEAGISYGAGRREAFDLFLPSGDAKGLLVFVHGGYWLKFHRHHWSHLAAGAVACGWAVAIPSYDLAPTARIATITRQIAAAVTAAAGCVAGPIVLTGHSAGGQLVARMACEGVLPDDVAARVTRVVPISPVTDLREIMKTSMNADLRLDAAEAAAESPHLHQPRGGLEVTVWVGAKERPVFLDQARWLADAWGVDLLIAGGRHHFDVIEALEDKDSLMMRCLLG
ncbi:alpha/beta hydrolase [Shimia biformata]|uniref:alpha/beta hydrolase n=1 Tax=Shimia biformata TaxID=1294299 RepID=UPI001950DB1C|nr:alpha/beta hydrolase [Shimia biformata]